MKRCSPSKCQLKLQLYTKVHPKEWLKFKRKTLSIVVKDMGQLELSDLAAGNSNLYNHCRKLEMCTKVNCIHNP